MPDKKGPSKVHKPESSEKVKGAEAYKNMLKIMPEGLQVQRTIRDKAQNISEDMNVAKMDVLKRLIKEAIDNNPNAFQVTMEETATGIRPLIRIQRNQSVLTVDSHEGEKGVQQVTTRKKLLSMLIGETAPREAMILAKNSASEYFYLDPACEALQSSGITDMICRRAIIRNQNWNQLSEETQNELLQFNISSVAAHIGAPREGLDTLAQNIELLDLATQIQSRDASIADGFQYMNDDKTGESHDTYIDMIIAASLGKVALEQEIQFQKMLIAPKRNVDITDLNAINSALQILETNGNKNPDTVEAKKTTKEVLLEEKTKLIQTQRGLLDELPNQETPKSAIRVKKMDKFGGFCLQIDRKDYDFTRFPVLKTFDKEKLEEGETIYIPITPEFLQYHHAVKVVPLCFELAPFPLKE